ncbi:unnamed protein product, partial [Coregonus sp. 'balchen']
MGWLRLTTMNTPPYHSRVTALMSPLLVLSDTYHNTYPLSVYCIKRPRPLSTDRHRMSMDVEKHVSPFSQGSMGVCPLLLLLSVALWVSVSAQGPPLIPTATTLHNVPVATTTTTLPTTAAPTAAVTTLTTTSTVERVIMTAGPSATPAPAPNPPPPGPTRATADPQPPPAPTTVSQGGGGENGTTPSAPETTSLDSHTDPPLETATEPTVDAASADTSGATTTGGEDDTDQDTQSDDTPIIAVMVALSSLLVIVFIIIILYMLRAPECAAIGPLAQYQQEALPVCPIQAACDAASKEENKEKNRYVNILPYDHSRVHLSSLEGVPDSDFINASFINGYQEKNKFIAAQGPKEETVNDFWRMIWEQNTATIVMVTNLKERKECKCAQYWPDQGCWTYGNIRVSVEDMMVLVDYTIRKFCIQQVGDVGGKKPQRLVTQFHFTSWPDFGVPFTPIGMLKFLKKVKTCNPQYAGPIVVHCSAGVGRTGTFIVIDAMLDMMNTERKVDVFGFVTRIRAQRCQMVQTDMQYVFIFQAMLEHYLYGDTELEVTSLESHLAKLYAPAAAAGCGGMEAEFKKLTSIKIQNDKMRTGNLPANMKKNRVLQIIPYEFNRVIIPVKRGEESTDYVNASFIDGYRQKDSYMASQGPLQHTIEDFWRMIWEWRSCSIVMLTELEERGQ